MGTPVSLRHPQSVNATNIEYGDAKPRLKLRSHERAPHISANDGDRIRLRLRHVLAHSLNGVFRHFGEREIVRKTAMALGHGFDADGRVVLNDLRLYIGGVGRDQPKAGYLLLAEQPVETENRTRRADSRSA